MNSRSAGLCSHRPVYICCFSLKHAKEIEASFRSTEWPCQTGCLLTRMSITYGNDCTLLYQISYIVHYFYFYGINNYLWFNSAHSFFGLYLSELVMFNFPTLYDSAETCSCLLTMYICSIIMEFVSFVWSIYFLVSIFKKNSYIDSEWKF